MFILSACSSNTPSDAAKEYGEYLLSGKYDKIVDMIEKQDSSKEEIEAGTKFFVVMMKMADEQIKKTKDGYKKFEVISESINGEKAEVVTKVTYGNGEEEESSIKFILKDGKWILSLL